MEETTLESLAPPTTTILPDDDAAVAVVSQQQDLADEQQTEEKVDEVQTAKTRNEEEDLQAEPSQIREVIVDPPQVASCSAFFGVLCQKVRVKKIFGS